MSKIQNVRLPNAATGDYNPEQFNQLVRSLEQIIFQLNSTYTPVTSENTLSAVSWFESRGGEDESVATPITFPSSSLDAFGRLVTVQPYTLFDSQNRYAIDSQFDTALTGSGTTTYLSNESSVSLDVTTTSGDQVVRQTKRVMPYQPGKGLAVLATFVMGDAKTNLRQRVGYFSEENGVFLQQNDSTVSFVLRSNSRPTPGTPSDVRTVDQADWNGDKMDGTGPSGRTLDLTKNQIFYMDFEWLGTGDVRCGFFVDGQLVICHTFHNDNEYTSVYMQTAILPVRYEITNTGTTSSSTSMKQVCSSVISMGGYEESSSKGFARRSSALSSISTTFLPLISIRLASGYTESVVLIDKPVVFPVTSQDYEVILLKNPTLTGASWGAIPNSSSVEFDQSATSYTGGTIVSQTYLSSTVQAGGMTDELADYNWDLQLGTTISGTSDIYTIAVRTLSPTPSGSAWASLSFFDLTD